MDELVVIFAKLDPFGQVFFGVFLLSIMVGVCAWCVTVVTWILLPFNAVPGAIKGWLRLNPLNIVFYSELLTPRGLTLRRWFIRAVLGFLGAIAIASVFGMLAMQMKAVIPAEGATSLSWFRTGVQG